MGLAVAALLSTLKPMLKSDRVAGRASQDPLVFVVVYALVTYGFATKMNRLMLMMGPISACLSGIAFGVGLDFVVNEVKDALGALASLAVGPSSSADHHLKEKVEEPQSPVKPEAVSSSKDTPVKSRKKKASGKTPEKKSEEAAQMKPEEDGKDKGYVEAVEDIAMSVWRFSLVRLLRKGVAAALVYAAYHYRHFAKEFFDKSRELSVGLSHPSIMFQATLRDGTEVMVDDYREAYWFLRDKTPPDSRVLAWWDYGYQITGIGNRTSIADGNTWNHEHIALIGRCLTSPEKRAHAMIKHLADYVLIWAGGGGDDLAKSPHMARIGNSVFDDICPDDPTCQNFGFYQGGKPTPMMANSLLFKLHRNRINPNVKVDPKRFKEVFMSEYGKVRIYEVVGVSKKSKNWAANHSNRLCDAPGSWYCKGQYPPALAPVLKKRRFFSQIEDFNRQQDEKAKKYHEDYMKRMDRER